MKLTALFLLLPLGALYFAVPLPVVQLACGGVGAFVCLSWLSALVGRFSVVFVHAKPLLRTFPNQELEISLTLRNRLPFPTGPLLITDSTGNLEVAGGVPRQGLSLRPFQRVVVRYRVTGRNRGVWPLGPLSVEGADPGGFFPWRVFVGPERSLVVYPKNSLVEGLPYRGRQTGDLLAPPGPWEDASRHKSSRYWEEGDDLRRLDPYASARTGRLVVRDFDRTLHAPAVMFLNLWGEQYPVKNRYLYTERAIETAASLTVAFARRREALGLATNGLLPEERPPSLFPGRSGGNYTEILETLAWVKVHEDNLWNEPAEILAALPSVGHGIYIGPPPDEAIDRVLAFLHDRGFFITLLYVGTSARAPLPRPGMKQGIVEDYGEIRLQVL